MRGRLDDIIKRFNRPLNPGGPTAKDGQGKEQTSGGSERAL
jgi:hypothetical protein